ncbi:hypothetical protein AAG570_007960 [Ranatra chinensis]|uniref:Malate dehydrogenase n=1 Tax=Ranatra chinensis TaxID=642074 RepID=A0ABD0YF54_9HEMI
MTECMNAVGTPAAHSNALAELLLAADVRGHYSHGLNRLEMYVRDIQNNICDGHAVPTILKENTSTAWVSGNNGLGPVVGNFCMNLAIQKAHQSGVGWVAAKNSNHYGMAAWYSMQAIKHGMMGITCSNTSPLMSPTRSKCAALGTNPISFATPALTTDDSIVLDMATTTVSLGKIEIQRRKGEKIPDSWAQGPDGLPTVDAEVAYNTRCLMPLGGPEEKSGYKGYGLALIIEALSGLAAGIYLF